MEFMKPTSAWVNIYQFNMGKGKTSFVFLGKGKSGLLCFGILLSFPNLEGKRKSVCIIFFGSKGFIILFLAGEGHDEYEKDRFIVHDEEEEEDEGENS